MTAPVIVLAVAAGVVGQHKLIKLQTPTSGTTQLVMFLMKLSHKECIILC